MYTSGIYCGIRHKPVGMCWSNTSYKSPPSLAWLPLYVSQPSHKPTSPLSLWRTVVWHTKSVCGKLYFRLYIHTSTVPFFFNYVIFIKTARMVSSLCCVSTLSALSSNDSGNKTTQKRSVETSTEYSLFCVIKFAVTSKHAVFWQNMLLREPQKCLNIWRKNKCAGLQKT